MHSPQQKKLSRMRILYRPRTRSTASAWPLFALMLLQVDNTKIVYNAHLLERCGTVRETLAAHTPCALCLPQQTVCTAREAPAGARCTRACWSGTHCKGGVVLSQSVRCIGHVAAWCCLNSRARGGPTASYAQRPHHTHNTHERMMLEAARRDQSGLLRAGSQVLWSSHNREPSHGPALCTPRSTLHHIRVQARSHLCDRWLSPALAAPIARLKDASACSLLQLLKQEPSSEKPAKAGYGASVASLAAQPVELAQFGPAA